MNTIYILAKKCYPAGTEMLLLLKMLMFVEHVPLRNCINDCNIMFSLVISKGLSLNSKKKSELKIN